MATKKAQSPKPKAQSEMTEMTASAVSEKKSVVKCMCKNCGKWATFSWMVLLLAGLSHMLPEQMKPVLDLKLAGITVQSAIGALGVVFALYFLLGDDEEN